MAPPPMRFFRRRSESPFEPRERAGKEEADAPPGDSVKTTRERAEEKRKEKLELVREQVECGSLVIREMTDEERQRYPPRPAPAKNPRGR